jgi:hypothetical protein
MMNPGRWYSKNTGRVIRGKFKETGYTTIELVAAITLTALILAVLAQFMLSGVKLWEKSSQAFSKQQQLKNIYQTLNRDLSAMFFQAYLPDAAVVGNDQELTFWEENDTGLVMVKYWYDPGNKELLRSEGFWGSDPQWRPIFKGITSWQFDYYDPHSQNWLLKWEPKENRPLPGLVRVTLKTEKSDLGSLVFQVKSWYDREKKE